ncbi:hypothetical protein [Klebsiella quasipneumoniae]|uniref:hypothetical protein n=1 Tax=Klebsiella quasipneumoniae TaxID=1463165 RepID=UPI0021140531|nr:hypothetical protein [Klebsiella quasipneumoniae]
MTDITELAQSHELLIANGQQTADLLRHLADNEIDSDYFAVVSECESYGKETDAELSITEFALRAAGYVDALVEALEKAQAAERRWHRVASRIHEQACESDVKIDELEAIRAAAEKLVRCKGRYHSEQNYRALAALFGVKTPDLPPLDDESRTVTVENLQESAYRAGLTAGWNLGLANNNEGFNKCLAAHTAGIKVEAE